MTPTERRENCTKYQGIVDDLKTTVFGNGRPGIREELTTLKTKITILVSLQVATTVAMITTGIKVIFFKGA